jgi:hypothetical protein
VKTTFYRTKARFWDAITEQAFSTGRTDKPTARHDLPEAAAELPSRYRMPYVIHEAA